MNCPHCNVSLVMSEKKGIEIDYCPDCRGIWLDRGELDKIIERSVSYNNEEYSHRKQEHYPNKSHESYHREHHHEKEHHYGHGDYKKHKKKSFLEDIFDFG